MNLLFTKVPRYVGLLETIERVQPLGESHSRGQIDRLRAVMETVQALDVALLVGRVRRRRAALLLVVVIGQAVLLSVVLEIPQLL